MALQRFTIELVLFFSHPVRGSAVDNSVQIKIHSSVQLVKYLHIDPAEDQIIASTILGLSQFYIIQGSRNLEI